MSGGFPKVKYKDLVKAMKRIGHAQVRSKGSHVRWEAEDGSRPATIPQGKPNLIISRTVWFGLKAQLGDELFEELRKHL